MENLVAASESGISATPDFDKMSFEELLNAVPGAIPQHVQPDDIVVATIVNQQPHGFGADIGGKTESFIESDEAGDIKVGDRVEVCVLMGRHFDAKGGLIEGAYQLSRVRVIAETVLSEMQEKGEARDAVVVGINMNKERRPVGLNVRVAGVPGFLPGSQLERRPGRWDLKEFLGQTIPVMLSQRVQKGGLTSKAVFSHKEAVAKVRHAFLVELAGQLDTNRRNKNSKPIELEAEIVAYNKKGTPGTDEIIVGALARVNENVVGFIHHTQVSFNRDVSVKDALPIGKKVTVTVQEVDLDEDKLKLSTKAATVPHEALASVNVGDVLPGKVFHALERIKHGGVKEQTGLLVGFAQGMVGHIARPEIVQSQDVALTDRVPVGSTVLVTVKEKKVRNGQLELTLAPMREPIYDWLQANVGQVVDARVGRKFPNIGVFVMFSAPAAEGTTEGETAPSELYLVDGLVHDSELRTDKREALKPGDAVKVKILSVKPNGDRFRTACSLA
jgi:ribosomal protein S1